MPKAPSDLADTEPELTVAYDLGAPEVNPFPALAAWLLDLADKRRQLRAAERRKAAG